MTRLSDAALANLPATIDRPRHDRSMRSGVVHFGPGAFHRAHQAPMFDALIADDARWGITGVSLNSRDVAAALNPQDGLYTLALLDAQPDFRIVGSIARVLTIDEADAIVAAVASPETHLVSATVTEKGYCLTAGGELDTAHPAILHDLAAPRLPRSFIGWLVAGLAERRRRALGGLTILSCDNLADNGRKLGAAVATFAGERDAALRDWIADRCRFPCSMVDSITPATDDALRARVEAATGLADAWPVQRERFTQWVIEDDFAGERPELERAGAILSTDVRGYEAAKLRLLNGAHSALAYLGLGLGYASVAEAMRDARLAAFVERLMREDIAPSVTPPAGLDIAGYIGAILARFANPAIAHRLSQIAWDGSQKLPHRLLGTIRDARAADRPIARLAVPIAAWMRFVDRTAAAGDTLVDPLADVVQARAGNPRAILDLDLIFADLGRDEDFCAAVLAAYAALAQPHAFDLDEHAGSAA